MIFNGLTFEIVTVDVEYKHSLNNKKEKQVGNYLIRKISYPPVLEIKLTIQDNNGRSFLLTYSTIGESTHTIDFIKHITIPTIEKCLKDNGHTIKMCLYNSHRFGEQAELTLKLCSYELIILDDENLYLEVNKIIDES